MSSWVQRFLAHVADEIVLWTCTQKGEIMGKAALMRVRVPAYQDFTNLALKGRRCRIVKRERDLAVRIFQYM